MSNPDEDAQEIVEDALVQEHEWSKEEIRRHYILEMGIKYMPGGEDDAIPPIRDTLEIFEAIEKWLIDGVVPPKPEDPKSKFKVVGKPDASS